MLVFSRFKIKHLKGEKMRIILNAKIKLLLLLFLTTVSSSFSFVIKSPDTDMAAAQPVIIERGDVDVVMDVFEEGIGYYNICHVNDYNKDNLPLPSNVLEHAQLTSDKLRKLLEAETLEIWFSPLRDLYMVHDKGKDALILNWITSFQKRIAYVKANNIPLVLIEPEFFHISAPGHYLNLDADVTEENVNDHNSLLNRFLSALKEKLGLNNPDNLFIADDFDSQGLVQDVIEYGASKSIYIDNRNELITTNDSAVSDGVKYQIPCAIGSIAAVADRYYLDFAMKTHQVFSPGGAFFISKLDNFSYVQQLSAMKQALTESKGAVINKLDAEPRKYTILKNDTKMISISQNAPAIREDIIKPFIKNTWHKQHLLLKDNYPETLEELEKIEQSIARAHSSQFQVATASV